jgi:hypothetical protein
MPKFSRQRSSNRDLLKRKWSRENVLQKFEKSSSEEEKVSIMPDDGVDSISFSNESILNDISDLFFIL